MTSVLQDLVNNLLSDPQYCINAAALMVVFFGGICVTLWFWSRRSRRNDF